MFAEISDNAVTTICGCIITVATIVSGVVIMWIKQRQDAQVLAAKVVEQANVVKKSLDAAESRKDLKLDALTKTTDATAKATHETREIVNGHSEDMKAELAEVKRQLALATAIVASQRVVDEQK